METGLAFGQVLDLDDGYSAAVETWHIFGFEGAQDAHVKCLSCRHPAFARRFEGTSAVVARVGTHYRASSPPQLSIVAP